MSIEVCEFLRPSLKAKVQDCGVLYLSDLLLLLRQCGVLHSGTEDNSLNDHSAATTTSAALLSHPPNGLHNISSVNETGSKRSTAQATLLAERLPRLTKLELVDLITSTQRYLQTLDMTTQQHAPAHSEVPQCSTTDTSNMALPALSIGPVTCAIRTLSELRAEAVAALQHGRSAHHATTFSRSLDTLLGGGAAVGELTELSGPPGAGKTQLLLQLAVSCVLPVELGGLDGECVFVDTEGSFAAERFLQLVVAAVALVRDLAARYNAATHTTNTTTIANTTSEKRQEDKRKSRRGRKRRRRSGGQRVTQNNNEVNNNTQRHRGEVASVEPQCGASPAMTLPSVNMEEEEQQSCYTVSSAPPCSQGSNPPCGDNFTQAPRHTSQREGEARQMNSRQEEAKAKDLPTLAAQFTVEYVLRRVHYVRITDLTTFMAFLYALPASLQSSASQPNQEEPAAVVMEDKQSDDVTIGENGLGASSPLSPTHLKNVKMVLIDSIAQPFRSFAAMNEGSEETTLHSASHANEQKGNTMRGDTSNGPRAAMSERERLWRRSRLIFTCAQRLQAYAAKFRLAIVVSNQVTSRTLNMPATDFMKRKESSGSSATRQRTTILLPALGDAWGYGVGTRVLLSFHHYLLPRTAACDMTDNSYSGGDMASEALMKSCPQEDMALCFASATTALHDGSHTITSKDDVASRAVDNVHQHRVARLLKSATEQRGECCFAITRKGIRDVYLLQSAMTGGN